jgi:hypothetical protein
MTYFDMNKGAYVRTDLRNEKSVARPIEYITKKEWEEKLMSVQSAYVEMNTKIRENRDSIEDLYYKHGAMCSNLNNLMAHIYTQESAPKVGKRRRRVVIQYD